ncbi:MAG: DUF721 domain-containing protein [Gemmatimonadaceae bacterium]
MPNDKSRPSPIAAALAGFLRESGLDVRVRQSEVVARWGELVGPTIAASTYALAVSPDSTLFVAVKSHAWMTELSMMERELLEAVNRATADAPIKRIRFQLAR